MARVSRVDLDMWKAEGTGRLIRVAMKFKLESVGASAWGASMDFYSNLADTGEREKSDGGEKKEEREAKARREAARSEPTPAGKRKANVCPTFLRHGRLTVNVGDLVS